MSDENNKYSDNELHLKIKTFAFQGFSLLKRDLDEFYDIRDEILRNNNPFYYTMLSQTKPKFSYLINVYRQQLEKLPEFIAFDEYLKEHDILSKFISGKIGTKCDFKTRWSHHYLLSFLENMTEKYFITNISKKSKMLQNELDDLFDQIYSDYEFSFYNRTIPLRNIIPLHNFQLSNDQIDLNSKLRIKYVSHEDLKLIFQMSSNLRIDIFDIGESPYVIEEESFEPIINSAEVIKNDGNKDNNVYTTITLLRLFKKGFVTYSYIYPIKGNVFPFDICEPKFDYPYIIRDEGDTYFLNNIEVFGFLAFWEKFRQILLKVSNDKKNWANVNLSLDRFNSSYHRPNNADRFIDLSIAIEALFSRKEEDIPGTLGHKYSLRLSRLLGAKHRSHKEFYRDMLDLYAIRSRIVHGNMPSGKLKIKTNLLENYVRRSLTNYLVKIEETGSHDQILDEVDFN